MTRRSTIEWQEQQWLLRWILWLVGMALVAAGQFVVPPRVHRTNAAVSMICITSKHVGGVSCHRNEQYVIYSITHTDSVGRPRVVRHLWILASKQSVPLQAGRRPVAAVQRDQRIVAGWRVGSLPGKRPNASRASASWLNGGKTIFLEPMTGTNAPLPGTGKSISPGRQTASSRIRVTTPGPEPSANGDLTSSAVIFKPTASEE